MTHERFLNLIRITGFDKKGFINYFSGYYGEPDSALFVFDEPIEELTCVELFEVFAALEGKKLRISVEVLDELNADDLDA